MRLLYVIQSFDLIMSSRIDHANREEEQDQSFILHALQEHFARLEVRMNDIRDRIKQNGAVLRRVLPQTQRQERRVAAALNHEELENVFEDEDEYRMEGEVLVRRCVSSAQGKEDSVEQQHGNIFHTRRHVHNKVFSLIIDDGSCVNVVSALLVKKLQLPTLEHPKPYMLR